LLIDLKLWMVKAANERDPEAALSLTNRINPKLFGAYDVGQFKVDTELGAGFYVASLASLLGFGLVFTVPLPRWRRLAPRSPVAPSAGAQSAVLMLSGAGLAVWMPQPAAATDLRVGTEYATLAQALAAAADDDTIYVAGGIHHEHLLIDHRVRLIGGPDAVID